MQKTKGLRIVLYVIFPILFNILFFMLGGFHHPASVWIAYSFIHLAWLLLIVTPLFTPPGTLKGIFNLSSYSVSLIYFLTELVVGIIIIVSQPQSNKIPLIVQLLFLGLYSAALISVMLANEHSVENTDQIHRGSEDIGELCARVKPLFDILPDDRLSRELQRTYNCLHAAPVSKAQYWNGISIELRQLESDIQGKNLEDAIMTCKRIQKIVG